MMSRDNSEAPFSCLLNSLFSSNVDFFINIHLTSLVRLLKNSAHLLFLSWISTWYTVDAHQIFLLPLLKSFPTGQCVLKFDSSKVYREIDPAISFQKVRLFQFFWLYEHVTSACYTLTHATFPFSDSETSKGRVFKMKCLLHFINFLQIASYLWRFILVFHSREEHQVFFFITFKRK